MTAAPQVFAATADNFPRLVLENSHKGPVLVYYWSPRAGPCRILQPRLEKLAAEFGGRFLLVLLNTDDFGALARSHGVTSIPTIKVFRRGEVVETLHGAESEAHLREFIGRHVATAATLPHAAALQRFQDGDIAGALRLAAEAALAHPGEPRIPLDIAKLLILQQRPAEAEELLLALPLEIREQPTIRALLAHASVLRAAAEAPPRGELEERVVAHPDDCAAHFQLAALALVDNDYERAIHELLEIEQRDAGFHHGAARRGLLAVFTLLDDGDERVRRARARLAEILH